VLKAFRLKKLKYEINRVKTAGGLYMKSNL